MENYSIVLKFTDEWVAKLNESGSKICFASGVGADPTYDIIAWCGTVASKVSIQWQEKYRIAATKSEFAAGVSFTVTTNTSEIKPRQLYTLPKGWTDGIISEEGSSTPGTFGFANASNDSASALIFKPIQGEFTPFYISQTPVSSRASESIWPRLQVALWLHRDVNAHSMVSVTRNIITEFDMTNRNHVEALWDGHRFVEA